jgi:hypothetical protein
MGHGPPSAAARDLTASEAPLTSPDAPQGIPTPPDAFPPAAPHTVDAYTRPRWPAALARWWQGLWRNASSRGAYMAGNRGGDQRYFPQRAEPGDGPAANGGPPPTA